MLREQLAGLYKDPLPQACLKPAEPALLAHHIDTSCLGDNPARIPNEAAFAKLCGVCPVEASSGKTIRHRLNLGGDRDANRALHVILVVRLRGALPNVNPRTK